ncbi:MAG TPA: M56 family metallopeptidase [Candidatus Eisenbacteria bacterium]|nr:M56 family metallopeptidase [Candidatus Eisenbacteria bacterium]
MTFSTGALFSLLAGASWGDLLSLLVRITLIAAVGGCLCALLRHASAAKRHLAATTTLAALIALPIAWALLPSVSLPILPAKPVSTSAVERTAPAPEVAGSSSSAGFPRPQVGAVTGITAPASLHVSGSQALALAILIAFVVTTALLLHLFLSLAAAWITARRARRVDDASLRRDLDEARARLGVSRPVDLRESASVGVPVVWGFVRPVLLLPLGARHWTREQLRVVFLHEVAHVARRDGLGLLLGRVVTSLFWFHPLVWMLAGIARRECERCCDDLVLAVGERPTDYAERLLAIVRSMTRPDSFAGVAPALAQRSNLEGRLVSILSAKQRRGPASRAVIVATIGSAALLLVVTATVQVVAAHPVGRLVDPASQTASIPAGDASSAVHAILDGAQAAPQSPEQSKVGEQSFRAGEEAFQEGSYVRAASSYLAAVAAGHRCPESLYRAASALAKAGASEDAMRTLEAAIEAGFDGTQVASDPNLKDLRSDPRFEVLVNPQPPSESMVASVPIPVVASVPPAVYKVAGSLPGSNDPSGIDLLRAGQSDRAIAAFEEEVRQTGSTNAMYNIACAYALRGDKRRAFDALERAIENGFDNSQAMTQDDDLRLLQGDPHFYQLVRLTKDLQLFGSMPFGFRGPEDWRTSLSRFERVTKEHPNLGRAWANLGFARLEAGDPRGGAAAYQRALDLGYQGPTVMYNLACCAARSGDVDAAFRWLDRADQAGFEIGEHVGSDSDLDALRGDRRYDDLLERWDQKMAKEHREKKKEKDKDKEADKTY